MVSTTEASPTTTVAPIADADGTTLSVAEVGGKAAALSRLVGAGFDVPAARCLTVAFFAPWWTQLQSLPSYARFVAQSAGPWGDVARALQSEVERLSITDAQRHALDEMSAWVSEQGGLCAVRSSSPDEDLHTASFAGGYHTELAVTPDRLERAVRLCFRSALDERVFAYKERSGFDVHAPSIAVIVQQQVASDVAGVAFSVNPVTNDHDELTIDASWGLGESVVSGDVTPDNWVIDKVTGRVLSERAGEKQVRRSVMPDGGVERTESENGANSVCLERTHLMQLRDATCAIEKTFGFPVDVEFAFHQNTLRILQARPITTLYPLPDDMVSAPGAPRRLYMDIGLTEGLTLNGPASTLGLSVINRIYASYLASFTRPREIGTNPEELIFASGARQYLNVSAILSRLDIRKYADALGTQIDAHAADVLRSVDRDRYRQKPRPRYLSWGRMLWFALRCIKPSLLTMWWMWRAVRKPADMVRDAEMGAQLFQKRWLAATETLPEEGWVALAQKATAELVEVTIRWDIPPVYAWMGYALAPLDKLSKNIDDEEVKGWLNDLQLGLPEELVVEMGAAMVALARALGPERLSDPDAVARDGQARTLPKDAQALWDDVIERFGCRGPGEVDVRNPRYGDTPGLLVQQLVGMAGLSEEQGPSGLHARSIERRLNALSHLRERLKGSALRVVEKTHRLIEHLGGRRDQPKFHLVLSVYRIRRLLLVEAERLVKAKKIDEADDIFHLTLEDLDAVRADDSIDLRARLAPRKAYDERFAKVVSLPHFVDSRGKILRPDRAL